MAKNLTGEQKAAILLRAIGEESAAQVMKQLDPKEIKRLGTFMNGTAQISRDEEDAVISDFQTASASGEVQFQGKEFIKTVLIKALGPDKAARIIESMTRKSYPGLDAMRWVDVKTLVQMLKIEHAQTVAVVLAHLESDQAGQVLAGLPEAMRGDVALRLATMEEVQPDVLEELSLSIQETLLASTGMGSQSLGGPEVMANILTRMDKTNEGGIMVRIAERSQPLADAIRALMFVFDDLVKIDERGLQELMKEISKDDLPLALRGANPEVKEKFFKNMSSRAAEMLKEDMEAKGPVKVSDVERAQQNILKVCRKLEGEGRIMIAGAGEEML
ncbi:MAG: flagellar motor switch protein FliG [Nitrospira sp.]|nr:flagellar motor switch protein FliG [Nitrospira sp.]MDH4252405.1 flagellar motor switch protein FliG [Nitrospira sp.]MDH4341978.1 flagellar motor switch protein FliG [Nitrospira sp.]MDH5334741.1 flagellar motor switch protein FliG [Nitrospira sp.]